MQYYSVQDTGIKLVL